MGNKGKRKQKWSPLPEGYPHSGDENRSSGAAAAATPTMECGICSEGFDEKTHRPRNLKCGHTFCSKCCCRLIEECQNMITCPKCRAETIISNGINSLSVNYPLLEILELNKDTSADGRRPEDEDSSQDKRHYFGGHKKKETSPHGGKCLEARAEVSMHCAQCDLWLCKDCSRIDHSQQTCILMPYQDTLKEMTQTGKVRIRATQQILENFSSDVNLYDDKLTSCVAILKLALDSVKKEQSQLPNILKHCGKLRQDMSDLATASIPADVGDALSYLDNLETATQATQKWVNDASTSVLKDQVFKLSKSLLQMAVQTESSTTGGLMGLHHINNTNVTLPVDMDGSRLLVHAAQSTSSTMGCILIKLNHIKNCVDLSSALAFLDISMKGRALGRVFIRLLGSTKRSRCFLLMCTGEAGPSFRNTSFHRVWYKGLPAENIWMGDYKNGDGSGGTGSLPRAMQDEIKGLSDEKTQVPISAGLIAARYEKNTSTIFRVYTRGSTGAVEEYAIGQVEYGLQVFQDAIRNNNIITDLRITDCGIVIEQ